LRIVAYRVTQTKYLSTPFDGEGAKLNGGRWNSVGTYMVYTASSLSLATLELLVHIEDISIIYDQYSVIPIEFDDSMVESVTMSSMPHGWDAPEPIAGTKILGDDWIERASSVILKVPSAITKNENNYLLNPYHQDFTEVKIGKDFLFQLDERIT